MLVKKITVILAAQLAAGSVIETSPQVIGLDATDLQRRAACTAAGVVNGQCGRYYRGTGCNDQIGAVGPGVCLCNNLNCCHLVGADSRHRSAVELAINPPMPSVASAPLVMVPMVSTVICSMMTTARGRLERPEMPSLVVGSATRRSRPRLDTASCAGTSAKCSSNSAIWGDFVVRIAFAGFFTFSDI